MATEKRLNLENADGCNETAKIKTHHARIVVDGTADKPYYSIEWFDPAKKEYYLGYSSYFMGNVFNWLSECFEIVDAPTVDAVEVVHGRWKAHKPDCRGYTAGFICSCCGDTIYTDYCMKECEYNYCPNCGAKMDRGEDND